MTISSRTPEGQPGRCPICGDESKIDPSTVPTRDAPCPNCGHLLSFEKPDLDDAMQVIRHWEQRRVELEAERLPTITPPAIEVPIPELIGPAVALAVHAIDDPAEVRTAEDLFWQLPEE